MNKEIIANTLPHRLASRDLAYLSAQKVVRVFSKNSADTKGTL